MNLVHNERITPGELLGTQSAHGVPTPASTALRPTRPAHADAALLVSNAPAARRCWPGSRQAMRRLTARADLGLSFGATTYGHSLRGCLKASPDAYAWLVQFARQKFWYKRGGYRGRSRKGYWLWRVGVECRIQGALSTRTGNSNCVEADRCDDILSDARSFLDHNRFAAARPGKDRALSGRTQYHSAQPPQFRSRMLGGRSRSWRAPGCAEERPRKNGRDVRIVLMLGPLVRSGSGGQGRFLPDWRSWYRRLIGRPVA